MFDFTTPIPLQDAVDHISAKTPIGSILRTRDWAAMPAALRNQAFFSAGVESVRVLDRMQAALDDVLTLARDPVNGSYKMDRSKFIADMQKLALAEGLKPVDPALHGGLQDPTSVKRLALIYDTQIGLAQGKSFWLHGQDPDILHAWPAQELIRVSPRMVPRGSPESHSAGWPERWAAEGGEFYPKPDGQRMVALKTSPVWVEISRFGHPWPPFDFNSGMGIREIDREDTISLGIDVPPNLEPITVDYHADLAATIDALDADLVAALQRLFGEQIKTDTGQIRWVGITPITGS